MKADLHMHSTNSDGSFTIREIFEEAKRLKLDAIAITDHDTLAFVEENHALAKEYDFRYIHGLEISAQDKSTGRKCHIVGLSPRLECKELLDFISDISNQRHENSLYQLDEINKLGFDISIEELRNVGYSSVLYKQHIMRVLVNKGHAKSLYGEFYEEYFKKNKAISRDIDYPSAIEAVKLIKKAGGIAILAHPSQYDNLNILDELIEAGLDGIETRYSLVNEEYSLELDELAKSKNLLISGGSDFHGLNSDSSKVCNIGDYLAKDASKILSLIDKK